jgi:hypothetical protein
LRPASRDHCVRLAARAEAMAGAPHRFLRCQMRESAKPLLDAAFILQFRNFFSFAY